jgi:hypothetical protein
MIQRHVSFIRDPSEANVGFMYNIRMTLRRQRILQIHYHTLDLDTDIMSMDIVCHPVFDLNCSVSETGFCPHLLVEICPVGSIR